MAIAASFLNFEDLASMDTGTYVARLRAVTPEPAATTIARLDAEIHAFELKHAMTSEVLRQRLVADTQEETLDVCDWLMALDLRAKLASASAR